MLCGLGWPKERIEVRAGNPAILPPGSPNREMNTAILIVRRAEIAQSRMRLGAILPPGSPNREMNTAILIVRRAEIAQSRMRLGLDTLRQFRGQPRFPD